MAKQCWFWCSDIEWNKEITKENWTKHIYETGKKIPFNKNIQQGVCNKCGKIYRREVGL